MKIGISFGLFLLLSLAVFFGHRHFNEQDSDQITHAQYAKQIGPPPELEPYGPPGPPPKLEPAFCAKPHQFTCGLPWPSQDPTGSVDLEMRGEIRALRLLRKIVQSHPNRSSAEVEEILVRNIYTENRRKQVTDSFDNVLRTMIDIIEAQNENVMDENIKLQLTQRLKQVELEFPIPASIYKDAVDIFTKNTLYYERTTQGKLRLRIGGAYLISNSSWFNISFTLAHELAHSIDPCELAAINVYPDAYNGLISCFNQKKWVDESRETCGKDDQVSEVFADWLATQVTSKLLEAKIGEYSDEELLLSTANSVKDLCEQDDSTHKIILNHHQTPEVRIGQIFADHPMIRKNLTCNPRKKDISYCQFKAAPKKIVGEI